jgi:hypothetical protein
MTSLCAVAALTAESHAAACAEPVPGVARPGAARTW